MNYKTNDISHVKYYIYRQTRDCPNYFMSPAAGPPGDPIIHGPHKIFCGTTPSIKTSLTSTFGILLFNYRQGRWYCSSECSKWVEDDLTHDQAFFKKLKIEK